MKTKNFNLWIGLFKRNFNSKSIVIEGFDKLSEKEKEYLKKKFLSTVKYREYLRSLKHYEKPFFRNPKPEHTSEQYLNQGEKFILPGFNDSNFSIKLLEILIELNDRKQKFELYFLAYRLNAINEVSKDLSLMCHFTFKPEDWKQKKYDLITLNKILNYYCTYINRASTTSNGLCLLFSLQKEITLKVLSSPQITDTSVFQVLNEDLIGKLNEKYLFDKTSYRWYQLKNNIWISMDYSEFKENILDVLKKYEVSNNMTKSLEKEIFTDLRRKFSLCITRDIDKRFIPFNNGVFNVETSQLTPYGVLNPKNQRFFFKYNINYDPKAKMSVDFVTWLFKITKRNPLYVNVLRNFFFLLLTRNNGYKTALYLYGSESEINILLKICEFILTTEGCIFTNLSSLNRVSIRNSLYHVNLIVFKNINFGKQRKSIFKAIINSEPIEFQFGKEYKPQSELNSLVLITSNQVWKNKNATIDYIIYLPIAAYAPAEASENKNLLIDDSFEASLSGFINFVLDNPKENLNLFSDIRQLNYKIDSYEESGGTFDGSTLVDPDSLLNLDYFKDYIKPTVGLENNASPFTSKISKRNFSTTRSSLINLNNKIILSTRSALNSQQLHVTVLQKFYFRIGLKLISNIGIFYNGQKCNLWINETPDKKTYVPGLRPDPKIDKYYNQGENFILPGSNDSSFDQKLLEILIKLNNCGGKHNDSCVLYFLTECNYSVDEKQKNILKQIIEQYSIPFEEQKDIYNPDKHLVLIYNVIFYYEKREFFDTVHLNFYKDRYKNAVLYKINNLNYNFFHTRHLNYEEKIILKVFRSLDLETFISWYSNKNIQRVFNEKYLYDKTSYSWYKFKNDIWVKLYFSEFKESIFEDLKEYGIFKYNMTEDIRRKLYYYLEKNLMINMNKLNIINKNFIPFKNGVLNLNNSPSMLYSYSNFTDKRFFFKFNVDFDSKAKMSIDFVKWLLKISKKNPFYMNIIRNFFFLLVTRNYEYKIALNLYDLTNSEINIFLNICENIVCSNGYISMNLSDINDIIKRRYIYNKNLIIVKDMESKNFKKTAILKKIINSEKIKINFSKFYKLTSNVNLNSLVIIISNHICKGKERNIKNIIYLPITGEKEISLQADLLKASLPGFINWVLDNPKENLNLFNDIRRLNYKIDCLEESKGTFDGSSLVDPNSLLDLDYFKNYIKRRS